MPHPSSDLHHDCTLNCPIFTEAKGTTDTTEEVWTGSWGQTCRLPVDSLTLSVTVGTFTDSHQLPPFFIHSHSFTQWCHCGSKFLLRNQDWRGTKEAAAGLSLCSLNSDKGLLRGEESSLSGAASIISNWSILWTYEHSCLTQSVLWWSSVFDLVFVFVMDYVFICSLVSMTFVLVLYWCLLSSGSLIF